MKRLSSLLLIVAMFFCGILTFSACDKQPNVTTKYEITAEYVPETATLAGTEKVTFENGGDGEVSTLKFQLYANAYRKDATYQPIAQTYRETAYYQGESYGEIVISSVVGAKSWEVMGEDENILYVHLLQSLFPGESVVLDIGFLVKFACVRHYMGVGKNTVNMGGVFPVLCGVKNGGFYEVTYTDVGDPFYQDCADFSVALTVPREYVVAATGTVARERALEQKKEYVFSALSVRDFAFVLSKTFKVLEKEVGGNTVAYYYCTEYADLAAESVLDLAAEAFLYLEETFGEYPYAQYTLVQTGLCVGGMAYPALGMLSDAWTGDALVRAIVHETAHQWWGVGVGSDQVEQAWQDEGLAEYAAVTFFEAYEKYGLTREELLREALREYRSYYDVYGSVLGRTDTKMGRLLTAYVSEYEYRCLAHDKAVVMFDTLRKAVGDDKFFKGLRRYYKENLFLMATPEHLIGSFERVGVDVDGFFDSFLQGKAVL